MFGGVEVQRDKNQKENIKLKSYKNGYLAFFIMYLFIIVLNDMFFKFTRIDYKYMFTMTLLFMSAVYFGTYYKLKRKAGE